MLSRPPESRPARVGRRRSWLRSVSLALVVASAWLTAVGGATSSSLPGTATLAVGVPALAASAPATHLQAALPATSSRRLVERDVFQRGDFVTQYTLVACVGASTQMMLNMIRSDAARAGASASRPDRTAATQARLQVLARSQSTTAVRRRFGGASAFGWAYAMSVRGGGAYRVRVYPTLAAAVDAVAVAIARTGRPAGLLVWAGVHAWVASGYRAVGDPAVDPHARVTGLFVSDPLWPRPANSHGRTVAPDTFLTTAALARHLVRYHRPRGKATGLNGWFVVVLPVVVTQVGLAIAI